MQGPNEIEVPAVVVAGPLGFYGKAGDWLYLGPRRETKQEALSDAVDAAELIAIGGATGAIAALRGVGESSPNFIFDVFLSE